jgi:hypothetical protein
VNGIRTTGSVEKGNPKKSEEMKIYRLEARGLWR